MGLRTNGWHAMDSIESFWYPPVMFVIGFIDLGQGHYADRVILGRDKRRLNQSAAARMHSQPVWLVIDSHAV